MFVYNRLQKKEEWIDVRMFVTHDNYWFSGSPPSYWYADGLEVGDVAYDSFGSKVAKVVNIDNYDKGGPSRNIFVDLKLRVDYDKKRNIFLYEYKPLDVGAVKEFDFLDQKLKGVLIQIGGDTIQYKDKLVKLKLKGIIPEVANKFVIGKKAFDVDGVEIAEIIDIKTINTSYYEYSDIRGEKILIEDPDYRDAEITLKLMTFREKDLDFFVDMAVVKVGSKIWIQFDDVAIEDGQIIEIIE